MRGRAPGCHPGALQVAQAQRHRAGAEVGRDESLGLLSGLGALHFVAPAVDRPGLRTAEGLGQDVVLFRFTVSVSVVVNEPPAQVADADDRPEGSLPGRPRTLSVATLKRGVKSRGTARPAPHGRTPELGRGALAGQAPQDRVRSGNLLIWSGAEGGASTASPFRSCEGSPRSWSAARAQLLRCSGGRWAA